MRYFTRELLDRYQSDNDDIANAAHHEWDALTERYREELARLWPFLPADFRTLLRDYPLHNARVEILGVFPEQTKRRLVVELIPDCRPKKTLVLSYGLSSGDEPNWHSADELFWLYDEVEALHLTDAFSSEDHQFRHSILLSDGRELEVRFRDFSLDDAPVEVPGLTPPSP